MKQVLAKDVYGKVLLTLISPSEELLNSAKEKIGARLSL